MTCDEDIEIPAFAEVALSSFSCTPSVRSASYEDGVISYQVVPGGTTHTLDLGSDEVNQDTLEASLRRYERLMNSVLTETPERGLSITMDLDVNSNLSFHLQKVYEYPVDAQSASHGQAVAEIVGVAVENSSKALTTLVSGAEGYVRGLQPFPKVFEPPAGR